MLVIYGRRVSVCGSPDVKGCDADVKVCDVDVKGCEPHLVHDSPAQGGHDRHPARVHRGGGFRRLLRCLLLQLGSERVRPLRDVQRPDANSPLPMCEFPAP
eukprot:876960-Prorocentrum_minimum.AAC.1